MPTVNHVGHGSTPSRRWFPHGEHDERNHEHTEHNLERPVQEATDRQRSDRGQRALAPALESRRAHQPRDDESHVADAVGENVRDDSTRLHCYREHLRAPVAEPSTLIPHRRGVDDAGDHASPANNNIPTTSEVHPTGHVRSRGASSFFIAPHRCR